MEDVISENESDDLDDFESAISQFRPASFVNLQFFNTLVDELFTQFDKLVNDCLIFRENEGHVGEISQ